MWLAVDLFFPQVADADKATDCFHPRKTSYLIFTVKFNLSTFMFSPHSISSYFDKSLELHSAGGQQLKKKLQITGVQATLPTNQIVKATPNK